MSKTPLQLQALAEALSNGIQDTVLLPKRTAPFTTVLNRALVTDFEKDLLPKFGIDRIQTQQIMRVDGETGPNGEAVYKPVNDIHDQVRFVGSWSSANNVNGQLIDMANAGADYVEISFYGTGVNLLTTADDGARDARATLDGGSEGSNFLANQSTVLLSRNYSKNAVQPVVWAGGVSSVSAGLHTLKIRGVGLTRILGFEIINAASTIALPSGTAYADGKKLIKSALSTTAYNSGFESGTLGTRGGHVLMYQKIDGSVVKAVTPTDAAAAYLTNANHANEEVVRTHNWREFGAGRSSPADDFSLLGAVSRSAAFTLDDGTTTLVTDSANVNAGETVVPAGSTNYLTFTFVGTGLDVAVTNNAALGGTISIDGVEITNNTAWGASKTFAKIVSGLPYGTHTVKFIRTASYFPSIQQFIVYAPKTPALPAGAIALADYFVMGDYAPATATGSVYGVMSTGVLSKQLSTREAVYVGTWLLSTAPASLGKNGTDTYTSTTNDYTTYTFFGSGFDFRFSAGTDGATSVLVSLQNVSSGGSMLPLNSTNFPTMASSTYGAAGKFNASTAILDQSNGSFSPDWGLSVRNLPLAVYTVKFLKQAGGTYLRVSGIEPITPIHAPKLNGPFVVQNTLSIGSQSIRDLRNFAGVSQKMVGQAAGVAGFTIPNGGLSSFAPVGDMSSTIRTFGNPIEISFVGSLYNSATGATADIYVYVDGVAVPVSWMRQAMSAGLNATIATRATVPVSPGFHKIDVYAAVNAASSTFAGTIRNFSVREL